MGSSITTSGNLIADRRYEYAQSLLAENDFATALDLLQQTTELIPNWAPLWFTIGETYLNLEQPDMAIEAFQHAKMFEPTDRLGAGLRIARITGSETNQAMSPEYVAALFDQYADRFDTHLTQALQYRGPEILFQSLHQYCSEKNQNFHFDRAVDLGCGTGLMAAKLWKSIDTFFGVDLSKLMVDQAKKSGFYSEVFCTDIVDYLVRATSRIFDLLIAADVLVYVSDLEPVFNQAARTLTSDGILAFTVQSTEGDAYKLGNDLRYHHSEHYLRQAASKAGLRAELITPCVTRQDAGHPVPGFVVILSLLN
jgi:predicted TPR repeat methyltransferase